MRTQAEEQNVQIGVTTTYLPTDYICQMTESSNKIIMNKETKNDIDYAIKRESE